MPWFIKMLIQIALVVLVTLFAFWILAILGFGIPGDIRTVVMVIVLLVCIGILWMHLAPRAGNWFGP